MNKVYFSKGKAKILFAVKIENSVRNISFSNFGGVYSTSDEHEQKAIEETFYFKNGLIYVSKKQGSTGKNNKSVSFDPEEFPEVTVLNDAVAILRGDPYKVHHSKLKSKDAILVVAKDLNISFPNLESE